MDAIEALMGRVSPAQLVEPGPDPAQLQTLLAAAARAPDHGRMQPWRFVLVEGEARVRLGEVMAQSLKRHEPEAPERRGFGLPLRRGLHADSPARKGGVS